MTIMNFICNKKKSVKINMTDQEIGIKIVTFIQMDFVHVDINDINASNICTASQNHFY